MSMTQQRFPPGGVGLVHDYLLTMRGAERTFASLADCWPTAPIYTTIYDRHQFESRLTGHSVRTSCLQIIGARQRSFRRLLPLFPLAVEKLPVACHDVIISSSSAFAHGVRPRPGAVHICYCHSPFRYVWHERELALSEMPIKLRPFVGRLLNRIKQWDIRASRRVTYYIANSRITQRRIADNYERESTVIHPPVDVERFGPPATPRDYFLYVGEVVSHKRVETAIRATQQIGAKIKVVGDGPERERLKLKYGDTVEFMGRVSDYQLNELYSHTKALIVPNVEEFGIAAVEAQAAGRPVVAIDEGGTAETVIDGYTGVLVSSCDVKEFALALSSTDFTHFAPDRIVAHAKQFGTSRFRAEILDFVNTHSGANRWNVG